MNAPPVAPRRADVPSISFNLAAIAIMAVLCGIGVAYGLQSVLERAQRASEPPQQRVERTLVGKTLHIPAAWLREPAAAPGNFASRIAMTLPVALSRNGQQTKIDVTLLPRSQARPSALLLDGVYLHQFRPSTLSGPPGLVGKPLYGTDGYEGETVWYDPISADPFVAKCLAPVAPGSPSRCLRTVYLATGIAAVYDFDSPVLWSWKRFDTLVGRALVGIGF